MNEQSLEGLTEVFDQLKPYMNNLLLDKYGNYVLQRFVQIYEPARRYLDSFCRSRFYSLSSDEFASRVMQKLIEYQPSFRLFVTQVFANNIHQATESISAALLLVACIKCSHDMREFDFIALELSLDQRYCIENKLFRRILVAFAERCEVHHLQLISQALCVKHNLLQLVNDKFSTYLIAILIERDDQPTQESVRRKI